MDYIEKLHSLLGNQILDMDNNNQVIISFVRIPDIITVGYFLPSNQLARSNDPELISYHSCECEELQDL